MLMADLIYANIVSLKDCDVLELGAGTGLPSIAAHKYGQARRVSEELFEVKEASRIVYQTFPLNLEYNLLISLYRSSPRIMTPRR